MTDSKRPVVTGSNFWAFSGGVSKKEMKYSGEGNAFLSLMLRIPSKNPKFTTTVFLKAFKEMAEQVDGAVEDGKDYAFTGYLSKSSYMKGEQKVYQDNYIITKFEPAAKAEFDVSDAKEVVHTDNVPKKGKEAPVPF